MRVDVRRSEAAPAEAASFASAVSLGVGTMIGAGIFALLGEAGAIAGNLVWASFVVGGCIALLSGYSLGKLGARYPSAGGLVEYLIHGYGDHLFAGAMSVLMYASALVSVSLVTKSFGAYAAGLWPGDAPRGVAPFCALAVMVAFVALNLRGTQSVTRAELIIVVVKFTVLLALCLGGLTALDPGLLAPDESAGVGSLLASVAVTFFAYEGFRVITNAAEDVREPERTIPRAILTAIVMVMVLYLLVAVVVFGTLTTDEVVAARENALAEAARPVFGSLGFAAVSVTALIATASAINASLYAVTNVTYQMAKDGELPGALGRPIEHSREGLLVSGAIICVLALGFDLSQIAVLGATSILLVHAAVHVGHLRCIRETHGNPIVVAAAAVASLAAAVVTLVDATLESPVVPIAVGAFVVGAFVIEAVLRRYTDRSLSTRAA
jgi:amino acid transporter